MHAGTDTAATLDVPPAWERSVTLIAQHRWRTILVIGAMDRGKSTYCRFLSHRLLAMGTTVALVDADVGQKDVGPPATLTLGYPEASRPHLPPVPTAWYFVGAVSPAQHLLPVVLGSKRLVDLARAPYVIVNTTGFVHGLGRILKGYKIDAIQPDVIVALEQGHELSALLSPYRHYRTLRLTPSPHAVSKSPQQRKAARERAFQTYFASAQTVTLPWRRLIMQGSLLLTGTRVQQTPYTYAARTAEGLVAVAAPGTPARPGVTLLPANFERHLLCGVAARRGQGLGLGILLRLDFDQETLTLCTPVPVAQLRMVQLGALYVRPDGHELGYPVPRGL
jgi:polynucleotide 5'-hydroxyl-kinase GRC3/NOL9